jgi:predicted permease
MLDDLKFALRQLHRSPGFAIAIALTLALAIGVNTAVFSMLDGFLLRKPPYPEPERIAALITHSEGVSPRTGQAFSEDEDSQDGQTWEELKSDLHSVMLGSWGGTDGVNLQTGAAAGNAVRYVHESRVSANYFNVLGTPLYLGRSFTEDEDRPHGPQAVVLSYALWQSTFRSDPGIVGRPIDLKGEPYTVVGVLPSHAVTPINADLFTPLRPALSGECGGTNCGILMRLKPGATWQQVSAQLGSLRPHYLPVKYKSWFYAQPLQRYLGHNYQGNDMSSKSEALMLSVGFILLIACANLAGLALVRYSRRTPEIATRLALGASRGKILRQLWIENLVLALIGAAAALGLAILTLQAAQGLLDSSMIPIGGFTLNARVLAFTLGASLLTSLLFGALPALETRRVDLRTAISAGSRAVAHGSGRLRQTLIAFEVALTVVLLAGAGLLVRTLVHLETLPPGFDARNVMTAKASLADARYHDPAAFASLLEKSTEAMRRIPGVEDAAVGLSAPYERGLNDGLTILDGPQAGQNDGSSLSYTTPSYFSTLRIPLLAGRAFLDSDTATTQPVAIVNRDFGRAFYHDPNPVGRHFKVMDGGVTYTIVGIVENVAKQPGENPDAPLSTEPVFYLPAPQTPAAILGAAHLWFQPSWIVRTHGSVSGLTEAMQRALAEADPGLPFSGFYSMQDLMNQQLQIQRIEATLLGTLAGLALLLSAIGIYALVSNLVVQRTREIGIRIALGSTLSEAILHIGSAGVIAAGAGVIAGLAMSFLALRALRSEIYGVSAYDPVTLAAVPVLLMVIAAAASLLPALRIGRIDPAETLRAE